MRLLYLANAASVHTRNQGAMSIPDGPVLADG